MQPDELRECVFLANKVAIDVMRWTAKDGRWYKRDGSPTGLIVAAADNYIVGEFRPDVEWNAMSVVLCLFKYVEHFRADEDIGLPGEFSRNPPMKRGQWRCRLLKHDPPGRPGACCAVADTLPLAVCAAALKANKWIWSTDDEKPKKKSALVRMDGSKPDEGREDECPLV